MGWYGPRGNCGCCGFVCEDCDDVLTVAVSSISAPPECPDGCSGLTAGTYVFRTVGSPFTFGDGCGWLINIGADNCGLDDDPLIYIGFINTSSGGCGDSNSLAITFTPVTGGVRVTVVITMHYQFDTISAPPLGTAKSSKLVYTWYDDFDTCADAVGATLTFRSAVETPCYGGGTGDFCGLGSCTVTIG